MAESIPIPGVACRTAPFAAPWLSGAERIAAAVIGAGALGVLLLAASLQPSQAGYGTHQQLGLPPCTWTFAFGMPCPACGMTTAFAHAARGDLLSSFVAQPFGALLALVTAVTAVLGAYASITGTRVVSLFAPCFTRRAVVIGVVLLLAAWGYKIAQFRGAFDAVAPGAAG